MVSTASDARSWMLRADVVATVLDHGALLLDLESKYFYQLNPSGWALAALFEAPTSAGHAEDRARSWGAPEGDLEVVRSFVQSLIADGLVEPAAADAAPDGEAPATWQRPVIERHAEPLQRVITSAFDPSIPLAE